MSGTLVPETLLAEELQHRIEEEIEKEVRCKEGCRTKRTQRGHSGHRGLRRRSPGSGTKAPGPAYSLPGEQDVGAAFSEGMSALELLSRKPLGEIDTKRIPGDSHAVPGSKAACCGWTGLTKYSTRRFPCTSISKLLHVCQWGEILGIYQYLGIPSGSFTYISSRSFLHFRSRCGQSEREYGDGEAKDGNHIGDSKFLVCLESIEGQIDVFVRAIHGGFIQT